MADFTIEESDENIDKLKNEARENRANLQLYSCAIGFLVVFLILIIRYLLRLFDYLAHPNLGAPFATDQK